MTTTRPVMCDRACERRRKPIAKLLAPYGEIVNPGFVEYEPDADRATEAFNGAGVDLIIAIELAYQKGIIPMRTLLPHAGSRPGLEHATDPPPAGGG